MAETVRVRCAVGRDVNGDHVVLGMEGHSDDDTVDQLCSWDCYDHFWITVEIPLTVEPVVVAEVESRRVRYSDGGPLNPLRHELEAGDAE